MTRNGPPPDVDHSYCREVESYLCRRNDGHLIRVVGPAFDLVCQWEAAQIPLRVVCQGIDRTVERREAKGGRRRPVRIEFCEADVLAAFDEWRRAVGVQGRAIDGESASPASRHPSLVTHVDRAISRFTAWRGAGDRPVSLRDHVSRLVSELDSMRATAKIARGETRQTLLARLQDLDRELSMVSRQAVEGALLDELRAQAERDLAPFRQRMPPPAFARSLDVSTDRLIREHFDLPSVAF